MLPSILILTVWPGQSKVPAQVVPQVALVGHSRIISEDERLQLSTLGEWKVRVQKVSLPKIASS